jgi:DNA-binding SARP family transcriptional activator
LVVGLAKTWTMNGSTDRVEALYFQAMEFDDCAEIVYRQLMVHLKGQGRDAEALDVYRRCEKSLQDKLGTKPSPETRMVYEALLSNQ